MLGKIKSLLFTNRTAKQTVAKNTLWLAVSNIGGRLIKAAIIVYAARILGAAEWGIFSYAVTITAFLTVFTDFGINSILVRNSTRTDDPDERRKILSTSFFLKLAMLTFGVLLILFVAPRLTRLEGVESILPVVALILIFDSLREFGFALNKVFEKMEKEAALFIFTNIAIVVFGFIFLSKAPTVKSFAYAYAIGTGLGAIATGIVLREKLKGLISSFNKKLTKTILFSAWPFAISGVLGVLMINTDILLIGNMLSADDVGLYSAADRIIQILYVLPSVFATSMLMTFSRLANRDNQKMRVVTEKIISLTLLAAIPISIGGFILGKEIVVFLFGGGYVGAALAFKILMLTLMVNFPSVIISNIIFSYDRQKSLIVNSALGGGINLVLDLIFIPIWGIAGSALVTLVAQLVSSSYLWWRLKKINYYRILPYLRKVVTAAVVMAVWCLATLSFGVNLLVIIGGGILVYFGVLAALKEPLLAELRTIVKV